MRGEKRVNFSREFPVVSHTATGWPRRLLIPLWGVFLTLTAAAQTSNEYPIKAACLYNLAKFVEWPPTTFQNEKDPIHICLLGQNPFGDALGSVMSGKTVSGRPIGISVLAVGASAANCQILFVGSAEKKQVRRTVAETHSPGILTVGDTEGFAADGGMVNLKVEAERIRMEINQDAAREANLQISSSLLSLARIVKKGNK